MGQDFRRDTNAPRAQVFCRSRCGAYRCGGQALVARLRAIVGRAHVLTSASSTNITFTSGTDSGSGIRATSPRTLQVRTATFANGTCGTYSAWSDVAAAAPPTTYSASLSDLTCYQWQLLEYDNVNNLRTYTSANTVKVDRTVPTGTIDTYPATPFGAGGASFAPRR